MKFLYIRMRLGLVDPQCWKIKGVKAFDGPLVGPLQDISTYQGQTTFRFAQDSGKYGLRNALAFGYSESATGAGFHPEDVAIETKNDFYLFDGFYFSQWTVEIKEPETAQKEVNKWMKAGRLQALSEQAQFHARARREESGEDLECRNRHA